jgi:hypothetical protein
MKGGSTGKKCAAALDADSSHPASLRRAKGEKKENATKRVNRLPATKKETLVYAMSLLTTLAFL